MAELVSSSLYSLYSVYTVLACLKPNWLPAVHLYSTLYSVYFVYCTNQLVYQLSSRQKQLDLPQLGQRNLSNFWPSPPHPHPEPKSGMLTQPFCPAERAV